MKLRVFQLIGIAILTSSLIFCFCAFKKDSPLKGSGIIKDEYRKLETLESLDIKGGWQVEIKHGSVNTCLVSMEENLFDNLAFKLKNRTLDISETGNITPSKPMRLVFTLEKFPRQITINGAVLLTVKDSFEQPAQCILEGAANIIFKKNWNQVVINTSGAAKVGFEGEIEKLKLTMGGASMAEFAKVGQADVDIKGASKLDFKWVDALKGKVEGISVVSYSSGKDCEVDARGIAVVRRH